MICIVMTIIVFINAILVISMSVWLVLSIDGGNIEKGWILNFLTILWLITTTHTNYSTASVLWDLNCQCFVRSQLPVFCEISTVSVLWDLNCQCFVRSQLPMFCEISTASVLWDLHSIQVGNVQKCIGKKIWIMVYLPMWSFCDYIMLHRFN